MGTELTRRGADTSPPLWSARALTQAPHLVFEIHREAVLAGADILTAATFRTHTRTLTASGLSPAVARDQSRELAHKAVDLARTACRAAPDRQVWVAGSLAPLEDCYRPDLVPPDFDVAREHEVQAILLAEAGADFILIETMNTSREARAAHRAVIQTGLPAMVSFVTDGKGSLLSGESLAAAARALLEDLPGPLAIGVNCIPARLVAGELARLHEAIEGFPLLAYGNTGTPLDERAAAYTDPLDPSAYAELARCWPGYGTRVAGSCCGTDASHTVALGKLFEKEIVEGARIGSSRR